MKITYKYIILFLLSIIVINTNAQQIIANGNTDETTSNSDDPIFLFSDISTGTLSAPSLTGSTYTWYTYSNSGWNQIQSGNDPLLSIALQETGYRVTIDNGISTDDYYCWVFQPEITSSEIEATTFTCEDLQLSVISQSKNLTYYNLTNGSPITLSYSYSYQWESLPTGDISGLTDAIPSIDSPYENTTYTATITAFNGASSISTNIDIEAIAVSADFTFSPTDRENYNELQDLDYQGSAPMTVSFTNESLGNITDYEWSFVREDDDYNYAPHLESNTNFTFEEVGSYMVTLTVSDVIGGCSDSKSMDNSLEVIEMELEAPNVFTPNGDGYNDEFVVVYSSVKTFKMVIVNRWGRKVFSTTNPAEGWDGRISGRKAAEGVYFVYIVAKGFNDGEELKIEGPLHLIRGE